MILGKLLGRLGHMTDDLANLDQLICPAFIELLVTLTWPISPFDFELISQEQQGISIAILVYGLLNT